MVKGIVVIILVLIIPCWQWAGENTQINLKPVFKIGDREINFDSITSICEDRYQNVFVLDRKAYKIYKLSAQGKLLLIFGQRGQGPRDFANPHFIITNQSDELVVCEDMQFVTFFNLRGKFMKRIKIPKGLQPTYVSNTLYYAWQWLPRHKEQILTNEQGHILKRLFRISKDSFSIAVPDETGRMAMPSFFSPTYTPKFLFTTNGRFLAMAVSNQYKILVMDGVGEKIKEFSSALPATPITASEKTELTHNINGTRRLYKTTKQAFIKKIPKFKNHLQQILINDHILFAFRMREIPGEERSPIPVDLYSLQGKGKRTAAVKEVPAYISNHAFYVISEDEEGWILKKFSFNIQ